LLAVLASQPAHVDMLCDAAYSRQANGSGDNSMLQEWIVEALRKLGGKALIVDVAEHIWKHHKDELERDRILFFTWQYRMRWSAKQLVDKRFLRKEKRGANSVWVLLQ